MVNCKLKRNKSNKRCRLLRSISGKDRKELNWKQAKAKYPWLSPRGNVDKDSKVNSKDCRPFDKKKQDNGVQTYGMAGFPQAGKTIVVTPKIYKAFQIIQYGKELGLPGIETHQELKSHGYTSDEARQALQLYRNSKFGANIESSYGGQIDRPDIPGRFSSF